MTAHEDQAHRRDGDASVREESAPAWCVAVRIYVLIEV